TALPESSDNPVLLDMGGEYDQVRQELDEAFRDELRSKSMMTKIVTVMSATFTVGIVSYLLRAGSLVASLMSTLPLWRGFDPIVVFSKDKKKRKDKDKTAGPNEPAAETFFDGGTK
ncbi:MAG: hypothetical protein GY695_16200, partial [Aestuariibacter sp.]|nr:hypothetical protein [Aestuariibacter sp.]